MKWIRGLKDMVMDGNSIFGGEHIVRGFPTGSVVKSLPSSGKPGFDPWVKKIPWKRKWPSIPVFLPGKSHRQRSLRLQSMELHGIRHDLVTEEQQPFYHFPTTWLNSIGNSDYHPYIHTFNILAPVSFSYLLTKPQPHLN